MQNKLLQYHLDRVSLIKELDAKGASNDEYSYQFSLLKKKHDYDKLENQLNDAHVDIINNFLNEE